MKLLLLIACCALPAIIAATHCPCATGRNSLLALLVILPSLIVAVSLAITGCVYYRHHRGARKKAPQSSDDGTMLSEEAEQGDPD